MKKIFANSTRLHGVVNVKKFGAFGNGIKDDTNAIRKAREKAIKCNKALYFPAGTYMLHGSVELWSGCEIFGEGGKTVIKKLPAVTQSVRCPENGFSLKQTTFTVTDAAMYTVGQDCCITLNWANIREGVYGKIECIDGNNITVKPYPHQYSAGLNKNCVNDFNSYPTRVLFSSSFPVLCTHKFHPTRSLGDNNVHDVYIHDLTIDGNRQDGEPCAYPLSAINLAAQTYTSTPDDFRGIANPHKNIRIENLNVYNSPSDGISVQSSKNVCITNCITENCGFNGIHLGVGTDIASVMGCKLNADYCGYYDCADVGSVALVGNHFEKCLYGIGGLDQYTNGLTITGNTFRGCSVGICAGLLPYPETMAYIEKSHGYISRASSGVAISNNAFYGTAESISFGEKTIVKRTGVGITTLGGESFIINGNTFHHLNSAIETGCAKYIRIVNNYIRDCNGALSMIDGPEIVQTVCGQKTCDSAFTDNTVQADAADATARIIIRRAKNMLVTGNVVTGADANITIGDDVENVIVENNIITSIAE